MYGLDKELSRHHYEELKHRVGVRVARELGEEMDAYLDAVERQGELPDSNLIQAYVDLMIELDPSLAPPLPEQSAVERFLARHPELGKKE